MMNVKTYTTDTVKFCGLLKLGRTKYDPSLLPDFNFKKSAT